MMGKQIKLLTLFGLITMSVFIVAQVQIDKKEKTTDNKFLKHVEAKNVCMGMGSNKLFDKELIPVVVDDNTYYGCCEGCVNRLKTDAESRKAVDPVSRKVVDKATAILGADSEGIVYYFENEENMENFKSESSQLQ